MSKAALAQPQTEVTSAGVEPLGLLPLTVTLRRLADLMLDEDEYDDDFLRPTRAAYDFAFDVIAGAQALLESQVPRATPAPIGDGSIFVEWRDGKRLARLIVPAEPTRSYIYLEDEGERAERVSASAASLADAILWMKHEGEPENGA